MPNKTEHGKEGEEEDEVQTVETLAPMKWEKVVIDGKRYMRGTAYTAAKKGKRTTKTCPNNVWFHPDDNVFYWDDAVRFASDELAEMNLEGLPMRIQHEEKLPPAGQIVHNWVDEEGNLCVLGEIFNSNDYERTALAFIEDGTCSDLSINYPLRRNHQTGEVTHLPVTEISFVTQGHFPGSTVSVIANRNTDHKSNRRKFDYRIVKASMSAPAKQQEQQQQQPPPGAQEGQLPAEDAGEKLDFEALTKNKSPEDIVKNVAEIKRQINTANRLAREKEEENKRLMARITAIEVAEKQKADQYAAENAERAQQVTAQLKEIVREAGLGDFSKEWEEINLGMHMSMDPLSQEGSALQVACSRAYTDQKKRIQHLEQELSRYSKAVSVGNSMATVEAELFEEGDRYERRAVKASLRNNPDPRYAAPATNSLMAPGENAPSRALPKWTMDFLGARNSELFLGGHSFMSSSYQPPNQAQYAANIPAAQTQGQRSVVAAKTPVVDPVHAPVQQPYQPPAQQRQGPTPLRPGFPVNEHSARNDPASRDFFRHAQNGTANVPFEIPRDLANFGVQGRGGYNY